MRGSEVQFGEVLLCNYAPSNKVSNIIRRHIDNRKLLLICILLLSHSHIFFRFLFCKYLVVFLFNTAIYVFLLEEAMYSSCQSMYSYCQSMYSYRCLCIHTVVHVFLDAATLTEVFLSFSSLVRQMSGYNQPRRGTACPLPSCFVVLCIVCV